MENRHHELVIIGGGPGGYVAAIRAGQLGMDVACVEQERVLGGACLRVGCIPSKALLESSARFEEAREGLAVHGVLTGEVSFDLTAMMRRKEKLITILSRGIDSLFRKNGVVRYTGRGRLAGPGRVIVQSEEGETELTAEHILLATGSRSADLPGVEFDGDRIGASAEALSYPEAPERLVVIGAGAIGLELGSVWRRLGARVTVLEYLDRILPGMDAALAAEALKLFKRQGMTFVLGCRVTSARVVGEECVVESEGNEPVHCDRVLVAVGRTPVTEGLGLETVGVQPDAKGRIPVDEHFATSAEGVYAVGDVIGGAMLAHKAEEEGLACVEFLATGRCHVNYGAIPTIVYTEPEIASVGKTEESLQAAGVDYQVGEFPFIANGRARTLNDTTGKVRILAATDTDRLLGVHILGPRAGDLIAEAAVALALGAGSEDLARSSHAHPTLAEAIKEAAMAVGGEPIHM